MYVIKIVNKCEKRHCMRLVELCLVSFEIVSNSFRSPGVEIKEALALCNTKQRKIIKCHKLNKLRVREKMQTKQIV